VELLIAGLIGGAMLLMLLFALALGRASRNTSARPADYRTIALARLSDMRSPSGKPFYPDDRALWKLAAELEDLDHRGRR